MRALGADAVIDYKAGPVVNAAIEAAPKGIDVYFDNVGGEHLEAALHRPPDRALRDLRHDLQSTTSAAPAQLPLHHAVIVARHPHAGLHRHRLHREMGEFYRDMGGLDRGRKGDLARDRSRRNRSTPQAFLDLFSGGNTGKMLVRL